MKLSDVLSSIKGDYEVYEGDTYIDEYRRGESIEWETKLYRRLKDKEVVSIGCVENRNNTKSIISIVVE